MLDLSGLNYFAIAVVWIIYLIVGAFWYSPAGFAKKWTELTGIDILKMPQKQANAAIMNVAVSAIFQVVALAVVLNSLTVSTIANAFLVSFLLWLGFTTATTVGVTFYSKRDWRFIGLNSSYFLLVMSIGSIVLTIWK